MMRHLIGLFMAVAVLGSSVAVPAGEPDRGPIVVELFTSQGCSSCPPADALLHELAQRSDVLALSMHVDYWDYIGWEDRFAQPAFTQRQHSYAAANGKRMVYTPQMIVGGQADVVGHKAMKVVEAIRAAQAAPVRVVASVEALGGGQYDVRLAPVTGDLPRMVVQLVRYAPLRTTEISHGENAGRTLSYANVVTELAPVAVWDGAEPREIRLSVAGEDEAAVVVQSSNHGAILAAARLR